jgi:hypothetical protein
MAGVSWLIRVGHVGGQELIAGVGVEEEDAPEPVMDQALDRLEIDALGGLVRDRNGAREFHMVGRDTRQQDRAHQNVGLLRNQLGCLDAVQEVRADGSLRAVLIERCNRDDRRSGRPASSM